MSASSLLLSLFKYKAWLMRSCWSNCRSSIRLPKEAERHTAIRVLNHIYVVDRIFAAHLGGSAHGYEGPTRPTHPRWKT